MQHYKFIKAGDFIELRYDKSSFHTFHKSISLMRITLLFGSLFVAMGLIILPIMGQKHEIGNLQNAFNSQNIIQAENEPKAFNNNFSNSLVSQMPNANNYRIN